MLDVTVHHSRDVFIASFGHAPDQQAVRKTKRLKEVSVSDSSEDKIIKALLLWPKSSAAVTTSCKRKKNLLHSPTKCLCFTPVRFLHLLCVLHRDVVPC